MPGPRGPAAELAARWRPLLQVGTHGIIIEFTDPVHQVGPGAPDRAGGAWGPAPSPWGLGSSASGRWGQQRGSSPANCARAAARRPAACLTWRAPCLPPCPPALAAPLPPTSHGPPPPLSRRCAAAPPTCQRWRPSRAGTSWRRSTRSYARPVGGRAGPGAGGWAGRVGRQFGRGCCCLCAGCCLWERSCVVHASAAAWLCGAPGLLLAARTRWPSCRRWRGAVLLPRPPGHAQLTPADQPPNTPRRLRRRDRLRAARLAVAHALPELHGHAALWPAQGGPAGGRGRGGGGAGGGAVRGEGRGLLSIGLLKYCCFARLREYN